MNQQCVIKRISEKLGKKEKINLGEIMRDCGYSQETSEDPKRNLLNSKGFQVELKKIDETPILNKWLEWATSDKDKRVAMEAGKEIMKLKDRYPDKKFKVGIYDEKEDLFK